MAISSEISWTGGTWNPFFGCTRVGPGCDHCYAVLEAHRKTANSKLPAYYGSGVTGYNAEGALDWTGKIGRNSDAVWSLPLRTSTPAMWFVNSMSDLFHEAITDDQIVEVFDIMHRCPHHTFQVLTKRPNRMVRMTQAGLLKWTPNIWAGTTIESDAYVKRADLLRKVPAFVRFVSAEPLLSALPSLNLDGLDWVISGGESGPGARASQADWHRDLRDRCKKAKVAYHFKQWGAFGEDGAKGTKKSNGYRLDGEVIQQFPTARTSTGTGSIGGFKTVLQRQRQAAAYATIKVNDSPARIALRRSILDTLEAAGGRMSAAMLRGHVLVLAGLDPWSPEAVNICAWSYVDLGKVMAKFDAETGRTNRFGKAVTEPAYRLKSPEEIEAEEWLARHEVQKEVEPGAIDDIIEWLTDHGFRPMNPREGDKADRQYSISKRKDVISLYNVGVTFEAIFRLTWELTEAA